MFIKLHLTTSPGHFVLLKKLSAWFAWPEPRGTRLYLRHLMEADIKPSMVPQIDMDQRVLLLHRAHFLSQSGSAMEVTCKLIDACVAFNLTPLTIRDTSGDFEVGIARDVINAITPAFDKDGALQGSNLFLRRIALEMDGPVLPVRESVETVMKRLGWKDDGIAEYGSPVDPEDNPSIDPPTIIRAQ